MSSPSYKPVILYQQIRRDGSCNIKLRITHKRKSKYLATTVTAFKGDYDKEYKLKQSTLLKLSDLLKQIDAIIATKTVFEWEGLDVEQACIYISEKMKPSEDFRLDFFEWGNQFIKTKSEGSRANYKCALKSFAAFLEISRIRGSML